MVGGCRFLHSYQSLRDGAELYIIQYHPEGIGRYVEIDATLGPSHHAEGVAQMDLHKQCPIPSAWKIMVGGCRFLHSYQSLRDEAEISKNERFTLMGISLTMAHSYHIREGHLLGNPQKKLKKKKNAKIG